MAEYYHRPNFRVLKHRRCGKKFDVAAVFEKELKVFGIESKLPNRTTNFIPDRRIGRSASPAIAAARMFEFQPTAVCEIQRRMVECDVHRIAYGVGSGVLRKVHDGRVTKPAIEESEILGEEYVCLSRCL
jgi:hypothetical protein